jgi:hypothetical protein
MRSGGGSSSSAYQNVSEWGAQDRKLSPLNTSTHTHSGLLLPFDYIPQSVILFEYIIPFARRCLSPTPFSLVCASTRWPLLAAGCCSSTLLEHFPVSVTVYYCYSVRKVSLKCSRYCFGYRRRCRVYDLSPFLRTSAH